MNVAIIRSMKRLFLLITLLAFLFLGSNTAVGQTTDYSADYVITDFNSDIALQKDASLLVKETINADFDTQKHGIFRIIPVVYSARGKTIKADFNLISITNEEGKV